MDTLLLIIVDMDIFPESSLLRIETISSLSWAQFCVFCESAHVCCHNIFHPLRLISPANKDSLPPLKEQRLFCSPFASVARQVGQSGLKAWISTKHCRRSRLQLIRHICNLTIPAADSNAVVGKTLWAITPYHRDAKSGEHCKSTDQDKWIWKLNVSLAVLN